VRTLLKQGSLDEFNGITSKRNNSWSFIKTIAPVFPGSIAQTII